MNAKLYKLLFLFIGLFTLVYLAYSIGLDTIWESCKSTGWWFIPVLLSWVIIYFFNARAFRHVIVEKENPKARMPFSKILQLTISGYAINYVTPFVALGGEPYRIMELRAYLSESKSASSVLLYGLMHVLSHILFWVFSVGLFILFLPMTTFTALTCITVVIMATFLCWWIRRVYHRGIVLSTVRLLCKLPFLGPRFRRMKLEKKEILENVDSQIKTFYSVRRTDFLAALSWEFLARVIGCAEIYFLALGIKIEMTFVETLIVSSGSSLFANLMFFFPMQLGTREGGMAMAMKSAGYSVSAGVLIGISTRIRELVWIAIGLIWMAVAKKRVEGNLNEIVSKKK